jgi:hypothetical protein
MAVVGVMSTLTYAVSPPYLPSSVIAAITWAPTSSIVRRATDSDNWPITWADDDTLYTAYGDGWGFDPKVPTKLSLGFAKMQGPATGFTGINIRSPTGGQTSDGAAGKKANGMLMVNGVLYMWVRNVDLNFWRDLESLLDARAVIGEARYLDLGLKMTEEYLQLDPSEKI